MHKPLPRNSSFTVIPHDHVPEVPMNRRLCVTCLNPMMLHYAWKSSERVIHYFFVCHCGSRTKGRLLHFHINSRGGLEK